jgi:5-methylcytosine-specific restriction endonuclease McrA
MFPRTSGSAHFRFLLGLDIRDLIEDGVGGPGGFCIRRYCMKYAYYGPRWPEISKAIKRRDGFLCQMHGTRCAELSIVTHHIVPVEDYGGNLQLANDPSNLITLCAMGHRIAHQIMEQANCDRSRYEERRKANG